MRKPLVVNRWPWCLTAILLVAALTCQTAAAEGPSAAQIVEASGIRGGLVVHVGCGDGRLTAALKINDRYLVQGLDSDPSHLEAARTHVRSEGKYGTVTVDRWSGPRLPYVDNLVNLLVVSSPLPVDRAEVLRVLCPGGVALFPPNVEPGSSREADRWTSDAECSLSEVPIGGQTWRRMQKHWPDDIDQWTHYLHDATGNAVARDLVVGPPRHLQWMGGPTWTRHHDHMSSFNAMVSSGGRVFYILDEGLRAEIQLPPRWSLIARDAFNGTVLWKRSIRDWHTHLWPLKSGPAQLPRRLVAVGDTVYVTLGLDAPLSALDAATGETIRVYEHARATDEIVCAGGTLYLVVNESPTARPWSTKPEYAAYDDLRTEPETWAWDGADRSLMAIEADTGETIWKKKSPVAPLTLSADELRVFFHNGSQVVCLDRATGGELWASQPVPRAPQIRSWFGPTLVVQDGVVVFSGGEKVTRHRGGQDTMTALSAESGEVLWTAEHPPSGYDSPEDILIIDSLVWTAPITNRRDSGTFTGRDLHTGQVTRTFPADDGDHMPHHRCHRAKATDRYILASRTGIEYVDLKAEHWNRHDWVRGACLYGIMPANGLTYAPPQSCACYILAKLNGLTALAPARRVTAATDPHQSSGNATAQAPSGTPETTGDNRLEKGPAYETAGRRVSEFENADAEDAATTIPHSAFRTPHSTDWPTYRHDAARSGTTAAAVSTELKRRWCTKLGGRLSSPVIADGRVFVAAIDEHAVYALDAKTGDVLWNYTAGGRVDSPPTLWRGRVLFGSADGWVVCLRAADGGLMWRFRAAANDERLTAFSQVESVWPVHGSVLVQEGIVHCVAGRSMFLDGGLRYVRLDAATGELLSETVLDDRHPDTGRPLDAEIHWPNLPTALPDILSCDGKFVYMRAQRFDLQGRRCEIVAPTDPNDQTGEGAHLFCPTGFLDDSWWHRTYWMYGKSALGGAGGWYQAAYRAPAGRIMVCDDARVYSFDRQPQYYPQTTALEYHLFAADKALRIEGDGSAAAAAKASANRRRPAPTRPTYDWSYQIPLLGRAIVLAGETLFVAGPPDLVDQELTINSLGSPAAVSQLAEQEAAILGQRGGLLVAVSAADGTQRAAYKLDSIPVFDGMAAAGGGLFLTTTDGQVVCLGQEGEPLDVAGEVKFTDRPAPVTRGGPAPVAFTPRHPDFYQLTKVQLGSSDLGYRLQTAAGQVGLAVKQLAAPLAKRATLKLQLRMLPNDASQRPPGNGFLVFGDAADDAHTVKCGLRNKGQCAMIVQGPLMEGKLAQQTVASKTNLVIDLVVTVDLEAGKVKLDMLGETVESSLGPGLESVRFIGYAVHSAGAEFGPIEVRGE